MRTRGYLAFVVGMCMTVWICVLVNNAQQAQLRDNFARDTEKVAFDTSVRLQTYFDMLLSIKGMYAVNEQVNRAGFTRFIQELNMTERYPGFQAVQFVRAVPQSGVERFSSAVRADTTLVAGGYPQFAVHPVKPREEHYIIEFNEPMKGNENAFGLDLSALAPHLAAIEMGRDSGELIVTERITLVQDKMDQPGFVARAPIYRHGMPIASITQRRESFVGLVAIVFRVNNLVRETIDPALLGQISIRIHDAGNVRAGANAAPDKNNLMFDSHDATLPTIAGLHSERRISVAQRQWVAQFDAVAGSRYSASRANVVLIGITGTIISSLN